MKKILLALMIFTAASVSVFAFDFLSYPSSVKGRNFFIDFGIGYTGWGSYSGWKMTSPPIIVTFDYCLPIKAPISVGGMLVVSKHAWNVDSLNKAAFSYLTFAVRGNWHWGIDIKWFDLYTGLSLGLQNFSQKWEGPAAGYWEDYYDYHYGGFYWGSQIGAHFLFTDAIGVCLEFGYPIYAKVALTLRFGDS